jgi:hypothetical protein
MLNILNASNPVDRNELSILSYELILYNDHFFQDRVSGTYQPATRRHIPEGRLLNI